MPIKPQNQALYLGGSIISNEWLQKREEILERDGHCCQICKVRNRTRVHRLTDGGRPVYIYAASGEEHDAETGEFIRTVPPEVLRVIQKYTFIVLTIAHLDQNPQNNEPDNLAALCQKHHLAHDRAANVEKRRLASQAKREAKLALKAQEKEARRLERLAIREEKRARKAAEKEARRLIRIAERDARRALKALEKEERRQARLAAREEKRLAKVAEAAARKAAKAASDHARKEAQRLATFGPPLPFLDTELTFILTGEIGYERQGAHP